MIPIMPTIQRRCAASFVLVALLSIGADAMSQPRSSQAQPEATSQPAQPAAGRRELFPGVFADVAERWVEIEGTVPIDAHNPETPMVYLELLVCTPDTKEHESLVVTRARPEHVHAALLAIGLTPGVPGRFEERDGRVVPVDPSGDQVVVTVRTRRDGQDVTEPITSWVKHARSERGLTEASPAGAGLVFAGSRMRTRQGVERYDADGMGTLIGLATFGAEVIAWRPTFSPDSWVDEPVWIADASRVPRFGTPVTVRIAPAPASVPRTPAPSSPQPPGEPGAQGGGPR